MLQRLPHIPVLTPWSYPARMYTTHNTLLTELSSLKQRALEAETIASIQTTLLQQKDHQITQLKEEHRGAAQECSALRQRLAEVERGSGGSGVNGYGLSVTNPALMGSGSGSVGSSVTGNVHQSATHPTAATLTNINTTHTNTSNTNTTHNTPHALATYSNDSLAQIESLKQQLDATFRELEQAKRGSGVGSVSGSVGGIGMGSGGGSVYNKVHYNTPMARSVYNVHSVPASPHTVHTTHTTPHTPHTVHSTHTNHTTPASPLSVHSTYSTVTGTSTNTHNTHNMHNMHNYVGDLQYISNLAAIQEESTVRSGTSTGANNTVDHNTINSTNSANNTNTSHAHSVYGASVYSAYNNVQPGIAEQSVRTNNTIGGNSNASNTSNTSHTHGSVQGTNSVQGTPLHTMLGGMYNMQQQQVSVVFFRFAMIACCDLSEALCIVDHFTFNL